MKIHRTVLVFTCLTILLAGAAPALCWSNGGFSANPGVPDYGTHDWIAQHALDYLPAQEKQYITDNLAVYLLGTELPDNSNKSIGGIGDTTKHHVYYDSAGKLVDDTAALRANETFNQALACLKIKNYVDAAKAAGVMTHYIDDLAVFCHVMGTSTDWGAESSSTHTNYENYVDDKTGTYNSAVFGGYLHFDGTLVTTSAYDAATVLACNSTFGDNGAYSCTWMNSNYGWSNQAFKDRCGESLNLAVNAVADVLHTLYIESASSATVTPSPSPAPTPTPTPQQSTIPTQTSAPTTPKPSGTVPPTPAAPEFPTATLIVATVLALTAVAILIKKKPKSRL